MSSLRFYLGLFLSVLLTLAASRGQDIAPLLQDGSLWQMSPQTMLNELLKDKSAKTLENQSAEVFIISSSNMALPTDGKANSRFNTLGSLPLSHVIWSWRGIGEQVAEWRALCDNSDAAAACEQARLLCLSATIYELKKGEKKTQQDINKIEQRFADLLKSVTGAKAKRVVNKDTATCREVTLRGESSSCVVSLNIIFQYVEGTKKVQREKEIEKGVVELVIAKDAESMIAYNEQRDITLMLVGASPSGDSNRLFEKTLLNGILWSQSPQMVYDTYLKSNIYRAIDDDIISITRNTRYMLCSFSRFLVYSHDFYWFWSAPDSNESPNDILADRALHWAQAWLLDSKISDAERHELFKSIENRRLKRISIMIYQTAKEKKHTAPPKLPDLINQLDTFCSQKGKQQTDKRDALGRKIKSWIWKEEGKYAIMLEHALQANKGKMDYIRLSFAPDVESLMYLRTAREHIATAEELAERAKNPSRLSGFKPYKVISFAEDGNPNVFGELGKDKSVLLYYGLCNIDDISYQDAMKQVKKIDIKSLKEAITLHDEASALYDEALAHGVNIHGSNKEENYIQRKKAACMSFFQTAKSYIDRGIPVIDTANVCKTPYIKLKGKYKSFGVSAILYDKLRSRKVDDSDYTFWCGYRDDNNDRIRLFDLNSGLESCRSLLSAWICGGHVYVLLPLRQNASK